MVNPFQRLIKFLRGVMHSRKRKTDMSADDPDSSDPDSSGDRTAYPQAKKLNRSSHPDQTCAIGDWYSHQYTAKIGPIVCDHQGLIVSLEDNRASAAGRHRLIFNCPYGDYWDDRLVDADKKDQQVTTGTPLLDDILKEMESQGFYTQKHIGGGRFGNVVLSYSTLQGKHVVLKFPKNPQSCKFHFSYCPHVKQMPNLEAQIHNQLRHPNILELLSIEHVNKQAVLHLEHCENGSLQQLLNCHTGYVISEGAAKRYFRCLINGLEYIHHQCIVHLDIRPDNLLINKYDQLKIADFGDAGYFKVGDKLFTKHVGAMGYKAPENMCKNSPYNPRLVDIWAAGCVLFKLVSGKQPFVPIYKRSSFDLMKSGIKEEYVKSAAHFTPTVQALLEKMIQFAPQSRESLASIKCDEWMMAESGSVQISGTYMTHHVQKRGPGVKELQLKHDQLI